MYQHDEIVYAHEILSFRFRINFSFFKIFWKTQTSVVPDKHLMFLKAVLMALSSKFSPQKA